MIVRAAQRGGRVSELKITFAGQTFAFEPGQTVRIGRSPENAVIVSDPIVSRDHARVSWRDNGWVLDDLGKGRTFVGGLSVASVAVQQPLDVHLATPIGPRLRIELAEPGAPEAAGGQSPPDWQMTRAWQSTPAGKSAPAGSAAPADIAASLGQNARV